MTQVEVEFQDKLGACIRRSGSKFDQLASKFLKREYPYPLCYQQVNA